MFASLGAAIRVSSENGPERLPLLLKPFKILSATIFLIEAIPRPYRTLIEVQFCCLSLLSSNPLLCLFRSAFL